MSSSPKRHQWLDKCIVSHNGPYVLLYKDTDEVPPEKLSKNPIELLLTQYTRAKDSKIFEMSTTIAMLGVLKREKLLYEEGKKNKIGALDVDVEKNDTVINTGGRDVIDDDNADYWVCGVGVVLEDGNENDPLLDNNRQVKKFCSPAKCQFKWRDIIWPLAFLLLAFNLYLKCTEQAVSVTTPFLKGTNLLTAYDSNGNPIGNPESCTGIWGCGHTFCENWQNINVSVLHIRLSSGAEELDCTVTIGTALTEMFETPLYAAAIGIFFLAFILHTCYLCFEELWMLIIPRVVVLVGVCLTIAGYVSLKEQAGSPFTDKYSQYFVLAIGIVVLVLIQAIEGFDKIYNHIKNKRN